MYFGKYFYRMRLFACNSLKDKRRVSKSIISRLQNNFKLSVAEAGDQDLYNSLCIACAIASSDRAMIEKVFYQARRMIEESYDLEIYEDNFEVY